MNCIHHGSCSQGYSFYTRKTTAFWDIVPYDSYKLTNISEVITVSIIEVMRLRFEALMMEALSTSETWA
jgi:hypothetical protein